MKGNALSSPQDLLLRPWLLPAYTVAFIDSFSRLSFLATSRTLVLFLMEEGLKRVEGIDGKELKTIDQTRWPLRALAASLRASRYPSKA